MLDPVSHDEGIHDALMLGLLEVLNELEGVGELVTKIVPEGVLEAAPLGDKHADGETDVVASTL